MSTYIKNDVSVKNQKNLVLRFQKTLKKIKILNFAKLHLIFLSFFILFILFDFFYLIKNFLLDLFLKFF